MNVISLERGNFKFSIGSMNDKVFLYGSRVAKQFVIGLVFAKSRFQYGYEVKETTQTIMNQNWRKKTSEAKQHPRSQGLVLQLHRPNNHVPRRLGSRHDIYLWKILPKNFQG